MRTVAALLGYRLCPVHATDVTSPACMVDMEIRDFLILKKPFGHFAQLRAGHYVCRNDVVARVVGADRHQSRCNSNCSNTSGASSPQTIGSMMTNRSM